MDISNNNTSIGTQEMSDIVRSFDLDVIGGDEGALTQLEAAAVSTGGVKRSFHLGEIAVASSSGNASE